MPVSKGDSSSHKTVLTSGFIFIVPLTMLLRDILNYFLLFLEQHGFFRKQQIGKYVVFKGNMC